MTWSSLVTTRTAPPSLGTNSRRDRPVDLAERDRRCGGARLPRRCGAASSAAPSTVQIEPSSLPTNSRGRRSSTASARGARDRDRGDERPRRQVVGPQLRTGRHVDPVAAAVAGQLRVVSRGSTAASGPRHAEIARRGDPVVAPRDEAAGHRVLREVGVRPLVDVVVDPVAPVLEELRRRPGVIDLVEVHLVGLGQAEHPDPEDRDDEDDEDPEVELVEPAAGLVVELLRAVRPDRSLARAWPGTSRSGRARRRTAKRSRSGIAASAAGAASGRRPARLGDRERAAASPAPAPAAAGTPARRRVPASLGASSSPASARPGALDRSSGEAPIAPRPKLGEHPQRHATARRARRSSTPGLDADAPADPEPVVDPGVVGVRASSGRRTCSGTSSPTGRRRRSASGPRTRRGSRRAR